jgi:hypothetical protein
VIKSTYEKADRLRKQEIHTTIKPSNPVALKEN